MRWHSSGSDGTHVDDLADWKKMTINLNVTLREKIHMQILPYYLHKDQSVPHDIGLKFSSLKFWTPL